MANLLKGSIASVLKNGNRYPDNNSVDAYFDADSKQILIPILKEDAEENIIDEVVIFTATEGSSFKSTVIQESTNNPKVTFFQKQENNIIDSIQLTRSDIGKYELIITPLDEEVILDLHFDNLSTNREGRIAKWATGEGNNNWVIKTFNLSNPEPGTYEYVPADDSFVNGNLDFSVKITTV